MIETILGIVGSIIMFCLVASALLASIIILGWTIYAFIMIVVGVLSIFS